MHKPKHRKHVFHWAAGLATLALAATTFLVVAPAQAVDSPHNLVIDQVQNTEARAQWQTVTGADYYHVYVNGEYAEGSSDAYERIYDLAPCTTYYVQLKARVNGSWSYLSTGSGAKTFSTTGCGTAPPAPAPSPTPTPPPSGSAATNLNWGTPITAGTDEFNYTGAPDSTKWNNYNTSGHHGNGQRLQAQSTVNGSVLTQTGLSNGDTGYISSKYRPGTLYGKWEARMRTSDRDPEYHPVMLLWPDSGGNSTTEDEVDFAEGTADKSKIKFFLHYGAAGSTTQTTAEKVIDTKQWHNYAVSWTSTGVRGYIDGVLWFEDTSASHNPDQGMHSSIQLDWFPDGTSTTQSWMQVDWIRQYQ
jgi:hypothetical protein